MLDLPPTHRMRIPRHHQDDVTICLFGESRTKPLFATGILEGGLIQNIWKKILAFKIR